MNDTQIRPIHEIIQDFLSPAQHFARLKANSASLEASTWLEIGTWYDTKPREINCGFVCPAKNREVVTRICNVYGLGMATETVLAYLYLKHRALFLKHLGDFHSRDGSYYLGTPMGDNEVPECGDQITAYGYSGCAAAKGDIVDFDTLNFEAIPFPPSYPMDLVWEQLSSDHQLGLGLIDYAKVIKDVEAALSLPIGCYASSISVERVLDDLAYWALEIEKAPQQMDPYLALVTHALLMRFL